MVYNKQSLRSNDLQKGQILLILILVITVALAVGLAVVQRSLTDVSISTRVEQSTRAFSAAEAGIERAIQRNESLGEIDLNSDSSIKNVDKRDVPSARQALEYPPVSKEEIVHVWLADPETLAKKYDQGSIDIYWGLKPQPSDSSEIPAIEVSIISKQTVSGVDSYKKKLYFFDPNSTRASTNNFSAPTSTGCDQDIVTSFTKTTESRPFCYRARLTNIIENSSDVLILLRARILYSNASHPVAVQPDTAACSTGNDVPCSLPVQAKVFISTGAAGDTQRTVQLFKLDKVVPFYFDYAIFSAGDIKK